MSKGIRSAICLLGGMGIVAAAMTASGPDKGDVLAAVIFGPVLGYPVFLIWNRLAPLKEETEE